MMPDGLRLASVREVLLQLGQAARIYGDLWDGMNSAAPAGVDLDRDSALEFLRNDAPVLQSAGFRVIVPAWWTATGQRRLRLRLAPRGLGASESVGAESAGMLGFDALVDFQAQVVLDGEPLTREEWERLVAAKEGLVQLRGQWMELRSDEVARLEEYWQVGDGLQTMTVADLVRAQAGSDRLEIDTSSDFGRMLARAGRNGAPRDTRAAIGVRRHVARLPSARLFVACVPRATRIRGLSRG